MNTTEQQVGAATNSSACTNDSAGAQDRPGIAPPATATIEAVFARCFRARYDVILKGGLDEPLYTPAAQGRPAVVGYRLDYAASALHEVAHWCIAGASRRGQPDYGYWYSPDGRTPQQQADFARVEARPQALERLFAAACGLPFRLSLDNLDAVPAAAVIRDFGDAVHSATVALQARGLPPRAAVFYAALAAQFNGPAEASTLRLSRAGLVAPP